MGAFRAAMTKSYCLDKGSTCQYRRQGFDPWDWEDPLEKEVATYCSILAWEVPWTEELVGCSSWDCNRVRHYLATKQQEIFAEFSPRNVDF